MTLNTKQVQGGVPERLRRFVAENLEALEPGLTVLETSLRLGRSTVDVVAVDSKQTLVLVAVAEVADAATLISALDTFIWCLAFPDTMRRLYPDAAIATTRPPRFVFVATHMPAAFLDLVERLSAINPECHELAAVPEGEDAPTAAATTTADPTWETLLVESPVSGPEQPGDPQAAAGSTGTWPPHVAPYRPANGASNGQPSNGHAAHGPATNGHPAIALGAEGRPEPAPVEHAAVNLGMQPRPEVPAAEPKPGASRAVAEPKPATSRPAQEETRTVNHPALQALRFPKSGVSRQWQEFLDQLAATQ